MKKIILLAIITLFVGTAAFADHPDRIGIGGMAGGSFAHQNDWFFYGTTGLSLKVPVLPVYWAFYGNFSSYSTGLGVTADYYILDRGLVSTETSNEDGTYDLKIDWYLGIGLFFDTLFWDGGMTFDVGARVPVGVSWHIIRPVELFISVGPAVGMAAGKNMDPSLFFYSFTEVGVRYWFK